MNDRRSEWFVPRFGPTRFRIGVGLLFPPYTAMVLSFTLIGSMAAESIHWDRVGAVLVIYFCALGIGAHALDALGSKGVGPWGEHFSRRVLWIAAIASVCGAYAVGVYYIIFYTPFLWVIAFLEGFFLFAYNLEWFNGFFHTDGWFVLSWGVLPVLAGYVLQTDRLSLPALLLAGAAGMMSRVEITASRPYKRLKRLSAPSATDTELIERYEQILKGISWGTLLLGVGLFLLHWR